MREYAHVFQVAISSKNITRGHKGRLRLLLGIDDTGPAGRWWLGSKLGVLVARSPRLRMYHVPQVQQAHVVATCFRNEQQSVSDARIGF